MRLSKTGGEAAARLAPDAVIGAFFGVLSRLEAALARPAPPRAPRAARLKRAGSR